MALEHCTSWITTTTSFFLSLSLSPSLSLSLLLSISFSSSFSSHKGCFRTASECIRYDNNPCRHTHDQSESRRVYDCTVTWIAPILTEWSHRRTDASVRPLMTGLRPSSSGIFSLHSPAYWRRQPRFLERIPFDVIPIYAIATLVQFWIWSLHAVDVAASPAAGAADAAAAAATADVTIGDADDVAVTLLQPPLPFHRIFSPPQ